MQFNSQGEEREREHENQNEGERKRHTFDAKVQLFETRIGFYSFGKLEPENSK
jgi:hypothetical protein